MKIGIIGAGNVGSACTLATIMRGCAREIVLVDKVRSRAKGVATDMRYGLPLSLVTDVRDGDYEDLAGSASQVFLWSSARVYSAQFCALLEQCDASPETFRAEVEKEVRYANITITEGNDASQYGIGMTCARIAEIILRDENAVIPIGSYRGDYGVTLSLPSIVGKNGVNRVLEPDMTDDERTALRLSAEKIRNALEATT